MNSAKCSHPTQGLGFPYGAKSGVAALLYRCTVIRAIMAVGTAGDALACKPFCRQAKCQLHSGEKFLLV